MRHGRKGSAPRYDANVGVGALRHSERCHNACDRDQSHQRGDGAEREADCAKPCWVAHINSPLENIVFFHNRRPAGWFLRAVAKIDLR
jgi:hypothetical protein